MKKIILIIVLATLCPLIIITAQSDKITIRGKIVDENALPVTGTTISVKGTSLKTSVNDDGVFVLKLVPKGSTLIITRIGYKTKEVRYSEKSDLGNIKLIAANKQLNEVTIVSTGYQEIPKERATGAFTHIDNKTINRNVGVNVLDRLEGLTSGLLLNRGLPNSTGLVNSKISIRGRSTLFANAEPLIVLDGLQYEGTIDQINAADIETIDLLKDAAAASIWGTRASNGVIVLTSKKGKNNNKITIGLSSTLTVHDKPNQYYKPQISSSDFIELEQYLFSKGFYNGVLNNNYAVLSPAVEVFNQTKKNLLTPIDSAKQINELKSQDIRQDLDHYLNRAAIYQQYQLNMRGGNESNRYYISGGFDKNLENSVSNSYDRYTLSANNTYSLLKGRLEISSDVNFVSSRTNSQSNTYAPYTPYDRISDNMGNSLAVVGSSTLRSSYVDTAGAGRLLDWHYRPKDELKGNAIFNRVQYRIKAGVRYILFDGLSINANYQYLKENNGNNINNSLESYYARNLINRYSAIEENQVIRGLPLGGILNQSQTDLISKIARIQLNYHKKFSINHEISAIAGYEEIDSRINNASQNIYGHNPGTLFNANNTINPLNLFPYYYEPQYSAQIFTGPDYRRYINITQSLYTNISYSYKNRYILSGSARNDRSNLFGVKTNQKAVPLWSTGIAWIINNESFYNLDWMSLLRIRATYGYNGNIDKTVSGYLTVRNNGLPNEWGSNYSKISNPPNPLLRWEKVKTWNLGIDYGLRNNRINGSIDLYQKDAIDLIGNNPIAMQSGVTQFRGNGASLRTKGIDLLINGKNLIGEFGWSTTLLLNYNTDKVTRYDIRQSSNQSIITDNFNNPLKGFPYYAIFSFPSAGLDVTGAPQGYLNGVISKDYAKIISTLDPSQIKYHGSASPKYFGSLINTFNYKQFEFSFNITYKFDYFFRRTNVFNGYTTEFTGTIDYNKRWQKPGDEKTTKIPAYVYPQNTSAAFFQNSEDLVEKGDHIRMQDIRVSCNLSNQKFFKTIFTNASVFLYAKNIGIIWRENSLNIDPDYGYNIPQPFSASVGVNLIFK